MWYRDQLVLTGELNEIGEAMAANVAKSYRMGVELFADWHPAKWFNLSANATISKNRIKDFVETVYEDEWTNPVEINHGDTHIAFSPSFIFNNSFNFNYNNFELEDMRNLY